MKEIKHTQPKARKEYNCIWCGEKILVGEKHHSRAYTFDGEFQWDRLHNECYEAMNNSDSYEGFHAYEQERGVAEMETKDKTIIEVIE